MAKQLYPNIVRGGMAIPLGNNYYFMKGRKHTQGGIDVGKDLEVEGGEIMKLDKNNVKVFSAVPFLNGRSPVEKILGGENPNKVFAQQERFKKVNKINDDGTKAKYGKRKINTQNIPESEQYAVTTPNGQRKVFNNKEEVQQYITANTPKGYSLYDTTNYASNIDRQQTERLAKADQAWMDRYSSSQQKIEDANESAKTMFRETMGIVPFVGEGLDLLDAYKEAQQGNYLNAGIGLGLMALPNIIEKPLKYVGRSIKKLFTKDPDLDNIIANLNIGHKKLEPINAKEKQYIPDQISPEDSQRLNDFWNNIFIGKYYTNRGYINKNRIHREPLPGEFVSITSTDPRALKGAAGHSEEGNAYIYSDINALYKDNIVIHEGAHNFRDSKLKTTEEVLANYNIDKNERTYVDSNNYTIEEMDYLDDAYDFTPDYTYNKLNESYRGRLAEKGSTNTELQYALYKKYNVKNISDLNKVIDNLTDDDLLYELQQTNGYGKNFVKQIRTLPEEEQIKRISAIRDALKYVPATIGVGAGLSLINNNENNQYKYGGKMNRQKAPFGILKNLGEIFGFSKKDDKPNETNKPKKTNKPISKIYIGGKPNEARQKYYDLDTEFADSVKAVSKRYGLNPNLVASRLAKEGPVDHNIKLSNDGYRFIRDVVFGPQWGLDDLGNHIKEGKVNIKESWNNIDVDDSFVNEKGRLTNTVYSPNWVDGIYGTAAELKYRRDYMKKHFPKMTEEQLDAAAAASFNRGNAGARKWINRGGNYMQYKPFIKLKQLGGKTNIYRLDSNGKSGLRMNISTGDETKARKKALLGTEDPYLSIDDSYRHFVDRSKFMEEWRKRNMLYANNPIGDKPDVNKLAKEIVTKPSNAIFIEAPKDIKINYSQGLKDYVKNATNVKPSINWNKIGTAIKPYTGSIIDTVGNIATSLINASTLNKMKYTKQPIPQIANKLKTSVNINPQLKTLNESYNQYSDYINNNTASSKVAREALQRARIKNVLDTNTLYATKENLETELINKDRINQQTIANANVDNYNKWVAGKAEFDNAILDKKSENIVGAINNITSSFNTSINNIKKDRQFNNNLISVLAANPNVNPEYLRALGADWVTDKMIEDWKLANKKK